jgi:hypothetical protein
MRPLAYIVTRALGGPVLGLVRLVVAVQQRQCRIPVVRPDHRSRLLVDVRLADVLRVAQGLSGSSMWQEPWV